VATTATLAGLDVLDYHGGPALITTALLAISFGLQNATVRRLAARYLTTTVLTLTLIALVAAGFTHTAIQGAVQITVPSSPPALIGVSVRGWPLAARSIGKGSTLAVDSPVGRSRGG